MRTFAAHPYPKFRGVPPPSADPTVKTDQGEMTPLHVAAGSKSLHAAQVLLEHGVDLEDTDSLGRTPLAVAAASGCCSIVKLLIQKGSNVQAKDKYGKSPLIIAVENLNWEDHEAIILVQTLLKMGALLMPLIGMGGQLFIIYTYQSMIRGGIHLIARGNSVTSFFTMELVLLFKTKTERRHCILRHLVTQMVWSCYFSKVQM